MDDIKKLKAVRALASELEQNIEKKVQQEQDVVVSAVDLIASSIKKFKEEIRTQISSIALQVPEQGMKGDKGDKGIDGIQGKDGKNGKDGKDGQDGKDGISIVDARLEFDGSLSIIFSDGKEINVGDILPQNTVEKFQVIARSGGVSQSVTDALVDLQNQIDALGGGGGSGTVTSVTGTGTVSGLTLSGTVTTSGNLTLGGAITGFATSGANTNLTSVALTSGTITTTPSTGNDIVNKTYADAIAAGIHFHEAVSLATTAALPANTYNNGTSGVGATLTATANGALSVDSTLTIVAERILVKNEATQANNGVYVVTQVGSAGAPYILTRATDFNTVGTGVNQIDEGDFFLVTNGVANLNTAWVQQTAPPITIGTTAIVFQQFAAPTTQVYPSGTGIAVVTSGTSWGTTLTAPSGAVVGTTDTQTLTNKRVTPRVSTPTVAGTYAIDTDSFDMVVITGQNVNITDVTTTGTPTNGQKLWFSVTGTAARTIAFNASNFESSTVTLPTTTVSTNRLDVGFVWNVATSKWRCVAKA